MIRSGDRYNPDRSGLIHAKVEVWYDLVGSSLVQSPLSGKTMSHNLRPGRRSSQKSGIG